MDIKDQHVIKSINFEGLRKVGFAKDYALKYYNENIDEIFYIDAVSSLFSKNLLEIFFRWHVKKLEYQLQLVEG